MRDPKRIQKMLMDLEVVWTASPDMRLGQLIAALAGYGVDVFNIEDDEMASILEAAVLADVARREERRAATPLGIDPDRLTEAGKKYASDFEAWLRSTRPVRHRDYVEDIYEGERNR